MQPMEKNVEKQLVVRTFEPDMNALKQTAKQLAHMQDTSLNLYGRGRGADRCDGARVCPGRRHRADGERGRAVRAGAGPRGPTAGAREALRILRRAS